MSFTLVCATCVVSLLFLMLMFNALEKQGGRRTTGWVELCFYRRLGGGGGQQTCSLCCEHVWLALMSTDLSGGERQYRWQCCVYTNGDELTSPPLN